jgi:hypothetical protein
MKSLQILGLLMILSFSSAILAQEKEKPKEAEKAKEVEKPKTSNPHGFIIKIWSPPRNRRQKPVYYPPIADVTNVDVVVVTDSLGENEEDICLPQTPGQVTTEATNPLGIQLTYSYTVSGGRVIGNGVKVFWDLSGVKPGTYTITAAVDDGCGFCGKTQTKTVVVKE